MGQKDSPPRKRQVIQLGLEGYPGRAAGEQTEPPKDDEGFYKTIEEVRNQLQHLTSLVDVLSSQHEHCLAGLTGIGSRALPTPHSQEDHPSAEATDEDRLYRAVEANNLQTVRDMLAAGADPNLVFHDRQCGPMSLTTSTPLVVALLSEHSGMVRLLLQAQADPAREYSFLAGAEQIRWSGAAAHAVIPRGSLSLLKELVAFGADLQAPSSTGANLLWQAAYFGQDKVVEYLLEQGVDMETKARSQDDIALSLSPLHAAAKNGRVGSVVLLLEAKAFVSPEDGNGVQPVDDAVAHGHSDVVQQLVAHKADIFRSLPKSSVWMSEVTGAPAKASSIHGFARCIDRIFASNNPILASAVAKGLGQAALTSKQFLRSDLIRFLQVPGDAPMAIWDAVFRPYELKYWMEKGNKLVRVTAHTAIVDSEVGMGIVEGPSALTLNTCFHDKRILPVELGSFKRNVTGADSVGKRDSFVPVKFYSSHLPYMHCDLQLIFAIVGCSCLDVFGVPGCRALIELKWAQEYWRAHARVVLAALEVVNLALLNFILNEDDHKSLLVAANALAIAVWAFALLLEVTQVLGYISHGMLSTYLCNGRHLFDMFALLLTGLVCGWTWQGIGEEEEAEATYRVVLGLTVGLKWVRLLISLRQVKSVGLRVLPILHAMGDTVPFMAVLSVFFMGAVNMLYALGMHTVEDAFLIIYRMVVLGDVNLSELEGDPLLHFTATRQHPFKMSQDASAPTKYREVVRILMLIVTFAMGVTMMNLFIAMLCVSFDECTKNASLEFVRTRAIVVLDHHAARKGFGRIFFCCRARRRMHRLANRPQLGSDDMSSQDSTVSANDAFIWFTLPKHV